MEPQGASEMSRLRLHLTKQEAWKAVARLTLAEPVAQRHQSQTRPAFLCARCKSERLTLLDRLAVFLLPDAVAFTLATGRIVGHSDNALNRREPACAFDEGGCRESQRCGGVSQKRTR